MVKERLLTKEEVEGLGYDPLGCFGPKIKSEHESCENKMASIVSYVIQMTEALDPYILVSVNMAAECGCGRVYKHGDQI